ncbi:hypothetical protein JMUB7468_08790 [Staphylococcus aureus]|uniref:hypothetical protein n=1 Tax=Staphylococcus aureus TaxID=1280 RepID=UPI0021869D38|nr:hypothetical protein [Staphylococcus aureus]BCX97627.1 hypothetical protein SA59458_06850 [Staphylococcus aureus]HCZ3321641.1 hypothetical protein [Staphylococcus aureus]HCZ3337259.1 hypothetical protein [Staphylococcus aureus]HDG7052852.1 hypothetical protein [Staphylococcus aureus]HDG7305819.1 hypothetical protein [Staphylococcus aureus]
MILYILINIAIVVLITGFNLYRHQMQHLSLSAMLLSITINAFINTFIIDKYNFITLCTITIFIIWTILQFYIDKKLKPVYITDQKFIAIILTIVVSLTQRVTDFSSTQSIYMSIPFLAPAIFIIGGIMLFISTFNSLDETAENNNKIKKLMIKGLIIINISFIVMMVLTPYWYLYLIVYLIFLLFLLWQKVYKF